jgi:hypothetical protein
MDREMKNDDDRAEEMRDEFELTPEEKMAFQKLPREAEASDLLEERVVRSLREEGILASHGWSGGAVVEDSSPGRGLWLRPWMAAAAVAASLALFTSGIFLGQSLGTRSTAQAFLAVREQDATQLAMTIQEAGSQYVSALAALGELRIFDPSGDENQEGVLLSAADLQQGREVALGALYGATYELARMSPEDMDVLQVLRILEDRKDREEGYAGNARNVVWF